MHVYDPKLFLWNSARTTTVDLFIKCHYIARVVVISTIGNKS